MAVEGFTIPDITLSPDGRYGVLVPDLEHYREGVRQNKLIEVGTERVLATIEAETGLLHMNHGGIMPARWSPDGSLLLWEVGGKWSPRALVLLKLENGALKWQLDLLRSGQREILTRTRKAKPRQYAAAKKANAEKGSDYPDGFTIDVNVPGGESAAISLPLTVRVTLTSNPKGLEDFPKAAQLDAQLEGVVNEAAQFEVTRFQLGRAAATN